MVWILPIIVLGILALVSIGIGWIVFFNVTLNRNSDVDWQCQQWARTNDNESIFESQVQYHKLYQACFDKNALILPGMGPDGKVLPPPDTTYHIAPPKLPLGNKS